MAKRAGKVPSVAVPQTNGTDGRPFVWKEDGEGRSYMLTDMGHEFYHTDGAGYVAVPPIRTEEDRHTYHGAGRNSYAPWSRERCEQDYMVNVRTAEEAYMASLRRGIFDPNFGRELSSGDYGKCSAVRLQPYFAKKEYDAKAMAVSREYFSLVTEEARYLKHVKGEVATREQALVSGCMLDAATSIEELVYWDPKLEEPAPKIPDANPEDIPDTPVRMDIKDNALVWLDGGAFKLRFGNSPVTMEIPFGAMDRIEGTIITKSMDDRVQSMATEQQQRAAEAADDRVVDALSNISRNDMYFDPLTCTQVIEPGMGHGDKQQSSFYHREGALQENAVGYEDTDGSHLDGPF